MNDNNVTSIAKKAYRFCYNLVYNFFDASKNFLGVIKVYFLSKKEEKPLAIVSVNNFNHGRYGFIILNYLALAGYQVCLHKSLPFLIKLKNYDKLIFKIPGLLLFRKKYLSDKQFNEQSIFININNDTRIYNQDAKYFDVDFNVFEKERNESSLVLPYYAHPIIQQFLEEIRNYSVVKSGGVLMYGTDDYKFDAYWIKEYFGKLSRIDIIETVLNSDLPVLYPKSLNELNKIVESGCEDKVVYVNTSLFSMIGREWLLTLKKFSFFVAPPGFCMPLCHNLIESLAMGTIPVLQHPEHFTPSLQNDKNCISFTSKTDLIDRIFEVLNMDKGKRKIIQENVQQYFTEHISPLSFKNKIDCLDNGNYNLMVNAEEISLKELIK